MRVCCECGRENVAHLPRRIEGFIPCACQYEDIIAGLKDQFRLANRTINELQMSRCKPYKNKVHQRNVQIKDLKNRLMALGK